MDREDVEEAALLPPAETRVAAGLCRQQQGLKGRRSLYGQREMIHE